MLEKRAGTQRRPQLRGPQALELSVFQPNYIILYINIKVKQGKLCINMAFFVAASQTSQENRDYQKPRSLSEHAMKRKNN